MLHAAGKGICGGKKGGRESPEVIKSACEAIKPVS